MTRTDALIDYRPTRSPWAGLDGRFADTFASRHTGYLEVDTAGRYTLDLSSSDGSKLWLDGKPLINNDGLHPMRQRSRTVVLSAGLHCAACRLLREYRESRADRVLGRAGIAKQVIPAGNLFQGAGGGLNVDRPFVDGRANLDGARGRNAAGAALVRGGPWLYDEMGVVSRSRARLPRPSSRGTP